MKTTMKLAFELMIFFGLATGAMAQNEGASDTALYTLLTYTTTGGFIKSYNNDSASWYGTEADRSKVLARMLWLRIVAMNSCGADTFKWVEDPNIDIYLSYPRKSTVALMPVIHHSVSRDSVIADLKRTTSYGLYCIKRYNSYVEK
jgi:hypothetical protein